MDFANLLASLAQRPGMYVGSCSLRAVAHLLDGYCLASEHLGQPAPLRGWMRWVEWRFGICDPAWHWTRILLHVFGSDAEAIGALPALFAEFQSERERLGVEGILARHEREFTGPQGWSESRVPKATATVEPFAEQEAAADRPHV